MISKKKKKEAAFIKNINQCGSPFIECLKEAAFIESINQC